jgi:hypothetical protein
MWMILTTTLVSSGPALAQTNNSASTQPSIDRIFKVWNARQEKVQSARFELKMEQTIHKGSLSIVDKRREREGAGSKSSEPNPPRDYVVNGTGGVSVSGSKLRYWYNRQEWDPIGMALHPLEYLDTFDGQNYKRLRNPASGQHNYPMAAVKTAKGSESGFQFPIAALFLTIRGNNPLFCKDIKEFKVTGRTSLLASRSCMELVNESQGLDQREVLYLDAERDFVVVRMTTVVAGQPRWQLDVTYRQDPEIGWVPSAWDYLIRIGNATEPHESGRYNVTKHEINLELSESEFDIVFPPGTRVIDNTSKQEVQYLIQENSVKGREIPTSTNPTYAELEKASQRFNRFTLLAIWGGLCVLALGGWLFLRRSRQAAREKDPAEPA